MKVMVNVLIGETARNREGVVEIGTATDTVATAAAVAATAAALVATAAAIAATVEIVVRIVVTATDVTVANHMGTVVTDAMVGMIVGTTVATGIEEEIATGEIGIEKVEETETVIATAEEEDATELKVTVVATPDR